MKRPTRHAFSMTEMLVVIAVLTALLGLLLPLLGGFRRSGQMTTSMSHLKQVAVWLSLYAGDNRDFVIPSQFDYSKNAYPGKVRSAITASPSPVGKLNAGTWSDIIWSEYKLGVFPEAQAAWPEGFGQNFRYDSPGGLFYRQKIWNDRPALELDVDNPLRSAVANSRNAFSVRDMATPFGAGAGEKGLPGYFAANNFFNADSIGIDVQTPSRALPTARWYTHGQIRMPERSMYLVDSFAGEVIQPWADRYKAEVEVGQTDPTPEIDAANQVDFRYSDLCLMLYLDGHSETQTKWDGIEELEGYADDPVDYDPANRRVRIRQLDKRISTVAHP